MERSRINVNGKSRCYPSLLPLHFVFACFILLALLPLSYAQEFNPKSVDEISLRILQTGELVVDGYVSRASLSLYMPQEGVQSINVVSNSDHKWNYSSDKFGNKIVVIEWEKPSGTVTYGLDIIVENKAKFVNPSVGIGYDPAYLVPTNSIVFTDEIRRLAYPFERTWANVARLTELVYDFVDYDISLVGQRRPSDWVYENRRGVCVEHANLLTSMLRASGIPARYVVGYAYSVVDKKLIGHTWIEVLAEDGTWVPFDPTWLQGGYVDATHIKTANLLDDNQTDVLTYFGSGKITWKRGDVTTDSSRRLTGDLYADKVEILHYKLRNLTSIELSAPPVALGGYGYIKATIESNNCVINQIDVLSCVDANNKPVFEIYEKERKFYSCGTEDVYWFFKETDQSKRYRCPVTVFDQIGSTNYIDIEAIENEKAEFVGISGPIVVSAGERFTLTASTSSGFIFYSSKFGTTSEKMWTLSTTKPGKYNFYVYSDNLLAQKTVTVVDKKEFELHVSAPDNATLNRTFEINVTAKNRENIKYAKIRVEFDGQMIEDQLSFLPNEEKKLSFDITPKKSGQNQLVVSLLGETLTTYSIPIFVKEVKTEKSVIDNVAHTASNFISSVLNFFSSLIKSVRI